MGTIFLRSDSDKWGQGLKWGQYAVPPFIRTFRNYLTFSGELVNDYGILQELNFDPKSGNIMKNFNQNTGKKVEAFLSEFWFELIR